MKKKLLLMICILASLFLLNNIIAINLDIKTETVNNDYVNELDKPAIFNISIKNLEGDNAFTIYSITGIEITPKGPFIISAGETEYITAAVKPQDVNIVESGTVPFGYNIKNSQGEIQTSQLTINFVNLEDVISVMPENINPKSENIKIILRNTIDSSLSDVNLKMNSAFFDYTDSFGFSPKETKEVIIPLDKNELKTSEAGRYIIKTNLNVEGNRISKEAITNFLEESDIETDEVKEGLIVRRTEITKRNVGNTRREAEVNIEKDLLSYLFTTNNILPAEIYSSGLKRIYIWRKTLIPNEELKVISKTNYTFPIIIALLIIAIVYFIKRSIEGDLSIRKEVSFVKTKGGQFALKVTLTLTSYKFLDNIHVADKLPPLVELYEKFGVTHPDKVDKQHRRVEWNIRSMIKGERRIFTYIIYSKVGVFGRFELPAAGVTYDKEGKLKHTTSNRSFFVNESKRVLR